MTKDKDFLTLAGPAFALDRRHFFRLWLAGGMMAACPSAFAAAPEAEAPKRGGTLRIGADADPIGLDPTTVTAFSSNDFTALLYSGLLRWNAKMQVEPDLATAYEMPDERTYVFKLRRGVKFHDGKDFTAEDVKYTFDRILDPATASRLRAQYAGIESVTIVDPFTVRFALKSRDAPS